jgi:hypothetical protein
MADDANSALVSSNLETEFGISRPPPVTNINAPESSFYSSGRDTYIHVNQVYHPQGKFWPVISTSRDVFVAATPSDNTQARQPPKLKVCPPPSIIFTGREDVLTQMRSYFATGLGKRHIFVLHGLGGAGKSQIAFKFIEISQAETTPSRYVLNIWCSCPDQCSYLWSFSDVFFVDATNSKTIVASLRNVALAKGAGNSENDALQWLSWNHDEWLLLLDNADNPKINLRDYFPCCAHGNILITSRNHDAQRYAPQSNYRVYEMSPPDAKDLLLNITGFEHLGDAEEYPSIIVKVSMLFVGLDISVVTIT